MRKKMRVLLLTLICLVGLTACGNVKEPTLIQSDAERQNMLSFADILYKNLTSFSADPEAVATLESMTDDEVDDFGDVFRDYSAQGLVSGKGYYLDAKTFAAGIQSYQESSIDIGDPQVVMLEDGSVKKEIKVTEDEAIVSIPLTGTSHSGTIEIIINDNRHVESIITNVDLTLAESMKKAGSNTAIGMGTVFVMLIVISWLISALGLVPKLFSPKKEEKKEETEAPSSVDNAIAGIIAREEADTDDEELVAVIAAAVAAYEGSSSSDGFVVRSIRKIR